MSAASDVFRWIFFCSTGDHVSSRLLRWTNNFVADFRPGILDSLLASYNFGCDGRRRSYQYITIFFLFIRFSISSRVYLYTSLLQPILSFIFVFVLICRSMLYIFKKDTKLYYQTLDIDIHFIFLEKY